MAELDYGYISTLVSRARTGDSDAFAELYAATYQKEYRFAFNYLKDEYLAQDALQETYILALKNLYTLRDSKLFISWLNQINFRVCFNMHRKQNRFDQELTGFTKEDIAVNKYQTKHHANPEEQVIRVGEREYIMKKILDLSFTESQAIIMKYYQNMKLEEIADVMEVSKSTVKRYLNSGRTKLAQALER